MGGWGGVGGVLSTIKGEIKPGMKDGGVTREGLSEI